MNFCWISSWHFGSECPESVDPFGELAIRALPTPETVCPCGQVFCNLLKGSLCFYKILEMSPLSLPILMI